MLWMRRGENTCAQCCHLHVPAGNNIARVIQNGQELIPSRGIFAKTTQINKNMITSLLTSNKHHDCRELSCWYDQVSPRKRVRRRRYTSDQCYILVFTIFEIFRNVDAFSSKTQKSSKKSKKFPTFQFRNF